MKSCILGICLFLMGCAANRVDLVKTNRLELVTSVPPGHAISASAYEQEGVLRLMGTVSKSPLASSDVRGHVDVEIIDPAGKSSSRLRATLHEFPAARHMSKPASFSKSIQVVPPDGSKVSLTYNPLPHSDAFDKERETIN